MSPQLSASIGWRCVERHVAISDNLKMALRDAVSKRAEGEPCLKASGELDMLVSEVPFHYTRPDAIVYRCIEEPRGKWKTKPMASDTLLVVEVVSPGTVTADLTDKRAEYARLGIPHYWIVRMAQDNGPAFSIERLSLTTGGAYVTEHVSFRAHGGGAARRSKCQTPSRSPSPGNNSTSGSTDARPGSRQAPAVAGRPPLAMGGASRPALP